MCLRPRALNLLLCFSALAQCHHAQPSPRLRPIQQGGRWGYVDSAGRVVIEPRFAWAEEFSEGLAAFEAEDGKHGYIDETARVTYGGRPSKDFGVFRAPGGELFVWVGDARYPWHYLVRPKEGTAETAFQGLLVTRSGKYVWQTKETEAFSLTYYRDAERAKDGGTPAVVTQNSVKFRSNDYDKDKSAIEVRW